MANEEQRAGSETRQLERRPQQSTTASGEPFYLSPREFLSPFSQMRRFTEEMDRMFGEFASGGSYGERNLWSFPIEISERNERLVVHAELPGLKPEDIKVEVNHNSLVIQGERRSEENTGGKGVHRTERRYGQFYRVIALPEGIQPEEINAKFEDGVLEVSAPLPKEQANRRQIPVQRGNSNSSRAGENGTAEASKQTEPRQAA
ncbi:MAG TPA: Hsp20/alpha crystallin family protein [Acidobacteriaceae bacterium]|nr:Hsp20/alpha crystallin family protein [Acidobacteriaceae bacterium]